MMILLTSPAGITTPISKYIFSLLLITAMTIMSINAMANSGLGYLYAVPACINGIQPTHAVELCIKEYPDAADQFNDALEDWIKRNSNAIKIFDSLCEAKLSDLYKELKLSNEHISRIENAAKKFLGLIVQSQNNNRSNINRNCNNQLKSLNQDLNIEDIESENIPMNFMFMKAIEPEFLHEPPPGLNANYQRERGLHFLESYGMFKELRTGITILDSNCVGTSLSHCLDSLYNNETEIPDTPDVTEDLPSGEKKVIFYGKKMLFNGTYTDNLPAGHEERVFILKDGKITDSWQRVQFIIRDENINNFDVPCEGYGVKGGSKSCIAKSFD